MLFTGVSNPTLKLFLNAAANYNNIFVNMRICITKQLKSGLQQSQLRKAPRASQPSLFSFNTSIESPDSLGLLQLESCCKDKTKNSINDSILIEDKENSYFFNQSITARNVKPSMCTNHPGDKAEYVIGSQGGEELIYCKKCATFLINQGFEVDLIVSESTQPPNHKQKNREVQIRDIAQRFQQLYEQVVFKKTETDFSIISAQSFFNNQIDQINVYFEQLYVYLEQTKNNFYNSILGQKETTIRKQKQWSQILQQLVGELYLMKQDIQKTYENVLELNQRDYQQLVCSLTQHLQEYTKINNSWRIDQVYSKPLNVPDIGEVLESIQNIFMPIAAKTPRMIKTQIHELPSYMSSRNTNNESYDRNRSPYLLVKKDLDY